MTEPIEEWCPVCFRFWQHLDEHLTFVHREEVVLTLGGEEEPHG